MLETQQQIISHVAGWSSDVPVGKIRLYSVMGMQSKALAVGQGFYSWAQLFLVVVVGLTKVVLF